MIVAYVFCTIALTDNNLLAEADKVNRFNPVFQAIEFSIDCPK